MRTDIFKDVTARHNQVLWLLLAFQGGFINTGGFIACHRFVSHMSGYGTYVGVELGQEHYLGAVEMALAPLFFLAGAIYAGWLVDRRIILQQEPRLQRGMIVLATLNLFIYLGEYWGWLRAFGEPLEVRRGFLLLFALCFSCGLQNGLFTSLTKGQVRTTHMTGPITDIGLNLVMARTRERDDPERARISKLNVLRVKNVISFMSGSLIATLIFTQMTYEGFVVPAAISLCLVWYVRVLLQVGGGGTLKGDPASLIVHVEYSETLEVTITPPR
jgi:uncharacterized membrane protein YoaK (UPF0700 family)